MREEDEGQGQDGIGTANDSVDTGQGSGDYSLSEGFLSSVPEEHRSIVEPYVKKWDAGVTRRFQDLHSQLSPYEQLGEFDDIQNAVDFYQGLQDEDSAREIFNQLKEYFEEDSPDQGEQGIGNFGNEEESGLPPELVSKLDQQQEVLTALAEFVLGEQQTKQETEEDAQLDSYLQNLHTEFGDFDEEYVLLEMQRNGYDGEKAVNKWNDTLTSFAGNLNSLKPTPTIMSGGGVPQQDKIDFSKIPRGELKDFVAQTMQRVADQGN